MAVQPFQKPGQFPGIFGVIVDAAHKTVLKGQSPSGFIMIIPAGVHDLGKLILLRNRHKFFPFLLARRVKRERQRDLKLLVGQPPDVRYNAAGGKGDVSLADM